VPYKDVVPLNVRLPVEIHAALVALAEKHDRSLHGEIVTALRRYVAEQGQRP
jgi:predicted transcriptional regulator